MIVLHRDGRGQAHDLCVIEVFLYRLKAFVIHLQVDVCYALGVFEGRFFLFTEKRTFTKIFQLQDFFL